MAAEVSIEQLVLHTLAAACRVEHVSRSTSLLDLGVDSLTLVAVLSQIEAVLGVELATDDLLALLVAPDVQALIAELEHRVERTGSPDER